MACHVTADAHFRLRGGTKIKMWIKTGYTVQAVKRDLILLGQGLQFRGRKVTMLSLNGFKFFEDQPIRS
jgi:hypothetical protein